MDPLKVKFKFTSADWDDRLMEQFKLSVCEHHTGSLGKTWGSRLLAGSRKSCTVDGILLQGERETTSKSSK